MDCPNSYTLCARTIQGLSRPILGLSESVLCAWSIHGLANNIRITAQSINLRLAQANPGIVHIHTLHITYIYTRCIKHEEGLHEYRLLCMYNCKCACLNHLHVILCKKNGTVCTSNAVVKNQEGAGSIGRLVLLVSVQKVEV